MAETRYHYATSLNWGGDEPTAEVEVEVTFCVAWGSPASGWGGPPENYDPGSGDVVEDIRVEKIDGLPLAEALKRGGGEYMAGETVRQIIDRLEADHEEDMLDEAVEQEAAARDAADDRRRED